LLRELGFSGVELNRLSPRRTDCDDLKSFLASFGLRLTMIATGGTAVAEGVSLTHADAANRERAFALLEAFVEMGRVFGAGVIIGYLKGPASKDKERARTLFREAMQRIESRARDAGVPLLVEATNRYESAVANSLDDTATLLEGLDGDVIKMLPDTFHMNIEERDMLAAFQKHAGRYVSVHFSDNNRFYPGLGAIDFSEIANVLARIGFEGQVALEGNSDEAFDVDVKRSVAYLRPLLTLE
jgi:sugar phosphate isomerase/epimerase